jgi:hypothetical protein
VSKTRQIAKNRGRIYGNLKPAPTISPKNRSAGAGHHKPAAPARETAAAQQRKWPGKYVPGQQNAIRGEPWKWPDYRL